MATIGDLVINLRANTSQFEKSLRGARGNLGKFGAFATSLRGGLAVGGATAVVGGLTKAIGSSEDFNRALNSSLAIMGNVSADMRGKMTAAAFDVASATKFSASEAAESYFFLASAGMNAAQSLAALPKVAQFAQAGNFSMALATDLLTDAQSALGLSVKDTRKNMENMSRVSNVLVKANTLANASVQQFSESLTNKAGASLRLVNKDIEEGVAVLAAFADQGVKGAEAGTALGIIMRDLQTKALANVSAFREAGVAVFDHTGKMRNIASIIKDIEMLLGGMSDANKKAALSQLGFADKSVAFIQTLVGTSSKIREYESALRSAGNATEEVSSKQMTPLQSAFERIKAAGSELGTTLGTPLATIIAPAVEGIAASVGGISDGFKAVASSISSLVKGALSDLSDMMGRISKQFGKEPVKTEDVFPDVRQSFREQVGPRGLDFRKRALALPPAFRKQIFESGVDFEAEPKTTKELEEMVGKRRQLLEGAEKAFVDAKRIGAAASQRRREAARASLEFSAFSSKQTGAGFFGERSSPAAPRPALETTSFTTGQDVPVAPADFTDKEAVAQYIQQSEKWRRENNNRRDGEDGAPEKIDKTNELLKDISEKQVQVISISPA
jgi:TP901 family phage tail tape measure protein